MFQTIDDYLDSLSPEQRSGLQALREVIAQTDSTLEECITYNIPAFRKDKAVVGFGAAKKHLSMYPMSQQVFVEFEDELKSFVTTKGTIQFSQTHPIPPELVSRIVAFRIAENQRNSK